MTFRRPLTQLAQTLVGARLKTGDIAIDATIGNGHDSLFLAQKVGVSGTVYGFDVQQTALEATNQLLSKHNATKQFCARLCSHEKLIENLQADAIGKVSAVMFNLGYLPGSDKSTITQQSSTLPALEQSIQVLKNDGIISILAYRGHTGGMRETDAVVEWLNHLPNPWHYDVHESPGPVLFVVTANS